MAPTTPLGVCSGGGQVPFYMDQFTGENPEDIQKSRAGRPCGPGRGF